MMDRPKIASPRARTDRIILHFDYDCFYAQVVENQRPELKTQPLGISQKSILATCNYVARRKGVRKLMLVSEAARICPGLVLADGEDLSAFRDVSKDLYGVLKRHSWNNKVERLGLDEVFMDVSDMVAYNVGLLNRHALRQSFFCLSSDDPEHGFHYDASSPAGCIYGAPLPPALDDSWSSSGDVSTSFSSSQYLRILVASHLAQYLRSQLEERGYTSACGISSSKLLSKLVGSQNKPRNQSALLDSQEGQVLSFMDGHKLRQIPGVGARVTRALQSHILAGTKGLGDGHGAAEEEAGEECALTTGQARSFPGMSPRLLEKLLGGPGSERGIGEKVWGLLHGCDDTEVKDASDIPTQISIEDTYKGLNEPAEVARELRLLSASLLRRMYVDLVEEEKSEGTKSEGGDREGTGTDEGGEEESKKDRERGGQDGGVTRARQRWVARPKTIRLSTRPKAPPAAAAATAGDPTPRHSWARASRSRPLPNFVFSFVSSRDQIVERLASEVLLPLFHRLNPARRDWNIGLINVCVAGMAVAGNDRGLGGGRDISAMFRRQEKDHQKPGEWASRDQDDQDVKDVDPPESYENINLTTQGSEEDQEDQEGSDIDQGGSGSDPSMWQEEDEDDWHGDMHQCSRCGRSMPDFAISAHRRYHDMEDGP